MQYQSKREEIINLFLKSGFSKDEFVVSTGRTFSNKNNKFRFEFAAQNREQILNRSAKYAVKYFFDQDFYILWKVNCLKSKNESCYRTVFSIDRDEAIKAYNTNKTAKKAVEFEWKFKENVVITDFDGLKKTITNIAKQEK